MKETWDLTKLYKTEKDFEEDLRIFKEVDTPLVASFEGKLKVQIICEKKDLM